MKNWKNFKTFQSRIYQKTSNNWRSALNAGQLPTGINAKINELSGDMLLVAENSVFKEIFSIYPMGTHGYPWVFDFQMGHPWATHAKLWHTLFKIFYANFLAKNSRMSGIDGSKIFIDAFILINFTIFCILLKKIH
jgi:hypothetical protein